MYSVYSKIFIVPFSFFCINFNFNSQAVGWDSLVPSALKSIFRGELIFESAA